MNCVRLLIALLHSGMLIVHLLRLAVRWDLLSGSGVHEHSRCCSLLLLLLNVICVVHGYHLASRACYPHVLGLLRLLGLSRNLVMLLAKVVHSLVCVTTTCWASTTLSGHN